MIDWLDDFTAPEFPATNKALLDPNGLLAAGGILSPAWLDSAYRIGVFPWNDPEETRMWWTPTPRAVITPDSFRIPKRLAREVRHSRLRITSNTSFERTMQGCAEARSGKEGTWIDNEIMTNYPRLYHSGRAFSVEAWDERGH
ncbi:MAG: leucyl/phenylalanyl-tRNA--protein transferase, partial [Thalassolituus sp.]